MSEARIFTLDEANKLIPKVEIKLSTLLEKKERYIKRHDELFMYELLAQAEHKAGLNTDPEDFEREVHAFSIRLIALQLA